MLSSIFLRWMSTEIMNNIEILYYDRIDFSEGIDVNKISESKE